MVNAGERVIDVHAKALRINLDQRRYGTFAEIGAGQEVVRWFFRVGGAAGTDRQEHLGLRHDGERRDLRQGASATSVARACEAMLEHEHALNLERLRGAPRRHDRVLRLRRHRVGAQLPRHQRVSRLDGRPLPVAPARSPTARSSSTSACSTARTTSQQEALGIVGVNLLYGAFFLYHEPELLIESLLDGLTTAPHRDRHDRVLGHRVPPRRQPRHEPEARAARAHRRGDVRLRRRRAAAVGGALQEDRAGRARQLPPGHARQHRHAPQRARSTSSATGARRRGRATSSS